MRDAARQDAEALQALHAKELQLGGAPLGHVGVHNEDSRRLPAGVPHEDPARFDDKGAAVFCHRVEIPRPFPDIPRLPKRVYRLGGVRRGEQHLDGVSPEHFRLCPAVDPLRPLVPVPYPVVHVADEDRVRDDIEKRGLLPGLLLRHLAPGDVVAGSHQPDDCSRLVTKGDFCRQDPSQLAEGRGIRLFLVDDADALLDDQPVVRGERVRHFRLVEVVIGLPDEIGRVSRSHEVRIRAIGQDEAARAVLCVHQVREPVDERHEQGPLFLETLLEPDLRGDVTSDSEQPGDGPRLVPQGHLDGVQVPRLSIRGADRLPHGPHGLSRQRVQVVLLVSPEALLRAALDKLGVRAVFDIRLSVEVLRASSRGRGEELVAENRAQLPVLDEDEVRRMIEEVAEDVRAFPVTGLRALALRDVEPVDAKPRVTIGGKDEVLVIPASVELQFADAPVRGIRGPRP